MTKEEKAKKEEEGKMVEEENKQLQEEVQQLQAQAAAFQDLHNLNQESYFRQQVLIQLEKMATSLEVQARATEKLLELSLEEEEKENKE